jgi:hypothetical protein
VTNLIFDIYNSLEHILSKDIQARIGENFRKFGNIDISELQPEYSWILTENQHNAGRCVFLDKDFRHFMYLKSYRCVVTNTIGYTFWYKNKALKPFAPTNHNWKKVYDLNSKQKQDLKFEIGLTNAIIYSCENCAIYGYRQYESHQKEIFPINKNVLNSCNENIIEDIIV